MKSLSTAFLAICFNDLWLWTPLSQLTYLLHNSCHSFVPFFVLLRMKTLKFPQFELLEFIRILGGKSLVVIYGFTTLPNTKICVKFICSLLRKITFPTLFEIFIFCPKIQLWFPEKIVNFSGWKTRENVVVLDFLAVDNFDFTKKMVKKIWAEKLVKMLGFWAF